MTIRNIFLFYTLCSVFLYANQSMNFTEDEQNYLNEKKEIKLCMSPKGLPIFGYKEGKYIGILAETMSLIEHNIPLHFEYVPVETWAECIRLSKEKKVDIAGFVVTSPNNHKHLSVSKKVIEGTVGIATKMQTKCSDAPELYGKKIAFLRGQKSIMQFVQSKFPNVIPVIVESVEEGLTLLSQNKVYGYADETYTLAYYIINRYGNQLKILNCTSSNPIGGSVGVRKDEPLLLSIVNKSIENIDPQDFRDIVHKWISVKIEKGFDYTLFGQIVVVFMFILLVSIYWIRRLSQEIAKRRDAERRLELLNVTLEERITEKIAQLHQKDVMLIEKTKLAAMGEMLGSIAHQWRKPLSTLHINIEMLEEDYKENKVNREFLSHFIQKNSEIMQYMSQTIDDFQNFYKIDKKKVLFDVMEKIEAVATLKLNQLVDSGISIIKDGDSFMVCGYPSEFQQVILNLIGNAQEALLERKIQNANIRIELFSDNSYGYISIRDNAGGIDKKILDKVFEPYFTMREKEGGTGLGLYMSKMIIEKNMQGKISISNSEEGTEVLIALKKESNV